MLGGSVLAARSAGRGLGRGGAASGLGGRDGWGSGTIALRHRELGASTPW